MQGPIKCLFQNAKLDSRSTELCRENCKNDHDCKRINSKEICLNKQCKAGCKTNKDCPDGSNCYKKTCHASCGLGSYCGASHYCHPSHHVCVQKCKTNKDCENGFACSQGKFQSFFWIKTSRHFYSNCKYLSSGYTALILTCM